jgi:hypothetical protein
MSSNKQPVKQRSSARIESKQNRSMPGWIKPSCGNEERRLLQELIEHLYEWNTDTAVFQFLCREYRTTLADTMNTFQTLRKVRTRLKELGVSILKFDDDKRYWRYWNDYSDTGMQAWRATSTPPPNMEEIDLQKQDGETLPESVGEQTKAPTDHHTNPTCTPNSPEDLSYSR